MLDEQTALRFAQFIGKVLQARGRQTCSQIGLAGIELMRHRPVDNHDVMQEPMHKVFDKGNGDPAPPFLDIGRQILEHAAKVGMFDEMPPNEVGRTTATAHQTFFEAEVFLHVVTELRQQPARGFGRGIAVSAGMECIDHVDQDAMLLVDLVDAESEIIRPLNDVQFLSP